MEMQKEILELNVRPEIYSNQLSELLDLRNTLINMEKQGEFPDILLIILVRDSDCSIKCMAEEIPKVEAERIENLWQELSEDLIKLSKKSEFRTVENSHHGINETNPADIINAIKELI